MSGSKPLDPLEVMGAYFDRIFVVTLKRAQDRQARVRERLKGLPFEFFEGFDKAHLDASSLAREGLFDATLARRADRHSRLMNLGELGCALSHRQIYENAVRSGWGRVLVFEDDAVPRSADLPLVASALGELPESWELLYLGYSNFEAVRLRDRLKQALYVPMAAARLLKWTPAQVMRFHPKPYSAHLRRAGLHHCTHAYAFTLEGARKLVRAQTPVAWVADQLLIHLVLSGSLQAFLTEPQFFDQERYAAPAPDREPASYVKEG